MTFAEKHKDYLPFLGRRKGRPLHDGRQQALQDGLTRWSIAADTLIDGKVDPGCYFPGREDKKLWIEVGFGNGEHLVEQAVLNPDINFIGCEPFINGVSAAVKMALEKNLTNIRFWADDANELLKSFKPACCSRIYVLFSDPWPKYKHHKRRVIQPHTVSLFRDLLQEDGLLRIATDYRPLAEWSLIHVVQESHFHWTQAATAEWRTRPDDWVDTRYQQKAAKAGRMPYFMDFIKTRL